MEIKHLPDQLSSFLQYLASESDTNGRLPPLSALSQTLGLSVASLREQLEVARSLGWVEVKPKTGIRRLPFSFRPAVELGLAYAVAMDKHFFVQYSDFRRHVEKSYWFDAAMRLEASDHQELSGLITRAFQKLNRIPVQIPHQEHRELHLMIYRRLENPFVIGVMEAYWDLYEAIGLDVYTDLDYLQRVWSYHEKMVKGIIAGNYDARYQALIEHMDLLRQRSSKTQPHFIE